MAKQKMADDKKVKLIYSGELILFAVIFITLATLKILHILNTNPVVRVIFNWITLFGGTWMIVDFVWVLCSKKRRAKNSLLDKALFVPLGIYLITFDLISIVGPTRDKDFYMYFMVAAFYYIGVVYLFEGIYHYFRPIPSIVTAINQVEAANRAAEAEEKKKLQQQPVAEADEVKEEKKTK